MKAKRTAKRKVPTKAKSPVKSNAPSRAARSAKAKSATKVKPPRKPLSQRQKISRVCSRAKNLGVVHFMVMPIEELQLSVRLAKFPRSAVLPSLFALAEHENMHARRVAFRAFHRMEAWDDPRVFEVLLRGLADPEGWVRYDAAWALGDSGTQDPRVLAALKKLARGAKRDHDISDDNASAASQAAESLAMLRKAR